MVEARLVPNVTALAQTWVTVYALALSAMRCALLPTALGSCTITICTAAILLRTCVDER